MKFPPWVAGRTFMDTQLAPYNKLLYSCPHEVPPYFWLRFPAWVCLVLVDSTQCGGIHHLFQQISNQYEKRGSYHCWPFGFGSHAQQKERSTWGKTFPSNFLIMILYDIHSSWFIYLFHLAKLCKILAVVYYYQFFWRYVKR